MEQNSRVNAKEWGEEIPLSKVVNPIIFHFRPNKYLRVGPERRKEWEQFFEENVGFRPSAPVGARAAKWPNGGISGSNDGWDD
jgi:hypothetical protein